MKSIDQIKRSGKQLPVTYLGDGAYAYFDGFSLIVTAENGIEAYEEIYLEPEAFLALVKFASKFYKLDKNDFDPLL